MFCSSEGRTWCHPFLEVGKLRQEQNAHNPMVCPETMRPLNDWRVCVGEQSIWEVITLGRECALIWNCHPQPLSSIKRGGEGDREGGKERH